MLDLKPSGSHSAIGFQCPHCPSDEAVITHYIQEGRFTIGWRLVCRVCRNQWDEYRDGN